MRCLRAGALALLVIVPLLTGQAAAQPPGLPFPGLPVFPPPAAANGAVLPDIQQWIDRVIPPPPIAPVPQPVPMEETDGMTPGLAALRQAVLPAPVGDPMFDVWPADLADFAPGAVIEVRDITASAAPLVVLPIRQALLFKFRTTDAHDRPSFATATLVIPATASPVPGARPVVVNNLPIDALGRHCTPGYTLAHGFSSDSAFTDFVPPTTHLAVLRGYAVLIPDHEGPLMAYAEPYVAGHAVLDAVRAVRGWRADEFGASKFAMTGYSGGAIATHGAVKLIESYAPDLAPALVGAALGGVPADYEILARSMNGNLASAVFMAAVFGIARERPEILARMNNLAQWVATSPMKDQCVRVFALPGVLLLPIDIAANIADPLQSTLARDIYEVTRMAGLASATPLYIYNGEQEFWIPAAGARNLYSEQCSLGVTAVYRSVLGEHVIAAGLGYPEAVIWLDERLRGIPAESEC
ncbi:lipase family protein [Nocardia jinanensis]|uniref:Lipase n=1 Tax=Nocardia jinanensis TaxID=382504 RepID=A0A917R4W6_9NOCA|nr:lipase family protein [Nocardia jinanensis]GGK90442.1 putative lipase [Nocardia jinanensis]